MSRHDEELKDFANMLYSAADNILWAIQLKSFHDCNDCGNKNCGYIPKPGQVTRINCPLWKREEQEHE